MSYFHHYQSIGVLKSLNDDLASTSTEDVSLEWLSFNKIKQTLIILKSLKKNSIKTCLNYQRCIKRH